MKRILSLGAVLLVLAAAFLFGGPRSLVDWRPLRAVVLESDDWGLAGFVPHAGAWDGVDRGQLETGRFPEVYWGSTLEDAAMMDGMTAVLTGVRDGDGLPALFQPNYVMGSLNLDETGEWTRFDLPDFPPAYRRDGLWDLSLIHI